MNLTPLDDVLDKHFGKVGTPKRDAFESDVDEALHAYRLGEAIKKTAKELGASKIYLESNTSLAPAINLYYKLGFQKITGRPTPYQRANIQMELNLK